MTQTIRVVLLFADGKSWTYDTDTPHYADAKFSKWGNLSPVWGPKRSLTMLRGDEVVRSFEWEGE